MAAAKPKPGQSRPSLVKGRDSLVRPSSRRRIFGGEQAGAVVFSH
jgi:hypothetical protein